MKKFLLLATIIMVLANNSVSAQDVFDPTDPIVNYDPLHPPTEPGTGVIGKWVRTPRMIGWDVSRFKSYIYNSMAFRLRYPNNFNKNDQTKKYPLILFLHGGGEIAENTDNEYHLLLGARLFQSLIDANLFNGYMFFPQQRVVGWEDTYFSRINNIIDSLTKYGNVDPDRIIVMGLSIGGNGTLTYAAGFPKRTASVIPSSPSFVTTFNGLVNNFIHIPVWMASGGLDQNPDPASARSFVNAFQNAGGNIRYSFFPLSDHDSWTPQWNEPYIITAWNNAHKANPLVFFNRTEFCPDSAINVKLGLSPGFYSYEWRKGDTLIATTTNNVATFTNSAFVTLNNFHEISINHYGTYSVRFKRTSTSDWSVWSPQPAVISPKTVTITPAIQVRGINSKVLPSIDGSTTVPLKLPPNYIEYEWRRVSDDVVVGTDSLFTAPVGQYRAKVKEQFGCSSQFSSIFTVVNAGGTPKPDAAKHLTAFTLSQTSIQLEWSDNANPLSDETGFEVYRSQTSGGPYTLVGITPANVKTFIDKNLSPHTTYYCKIRSVNETGASGLTNEANATTVTDITAPNAPSNLKVSLTFRTFVELTWNSPTDNVGVYKYDVYVNGVKKFTTSDSTFRVNNLQPLQTFNFYVKARDASGNVSPASNQVTGSTVLTGLRYKYYEGVWNVLPNFNTLSPISTGITPNVDILTPRRPGVNDFYGLVWEGYINITTPGTYKFETNSDDGTRVYWNSFYDPAATPLIDNDGIQPPTLVSGTVNIPAAGLYPIAITFFEYNNGELFEFYWTPPGGTRQLIPNSAFTDSYTVPGTVPNAPTNLIASQVAFDRITMTWTDNSSNETGFELYRSTSLTGT